MTDLERRIVDLELRYMKLDREARELSEVVAAHQRTIDALTLELRQQRERLAQGEEPAGHDKPPHY